MNTLKITMITLMVLLIQSCTNTNSNEKLNKETMTSNTVKQWPNDAQLVISFSMQFETGGQPEGAESPFSGNPLPKGNPDLPAESWFRYGAK